MLFRLGSVPVVVTIASTLAKLDHFELFILDEIGYDIKTDDETSIQSELIVHRYERRSFKITANHPFSTR
ncbi:ATP-binding protein [Acaryochloris marina]|uniref:ATP-binding protein n=1 Tax=Acaryochloris marina TaxID=155978 RepID=UPI000A05BB95